MNMSKKIILIGSGVLAVGSMIVDFGFYKNFPDIFSYAMLFVPIFIFSIITYFLNEQIFLAWRKFTLWWFLISFVLILIVPSEDNFFGNIKEITALFSVGGYTLFSTILILYKSYKLRGK